MVLKFFESNVYIYKSVVLVTGSSDATVKVVNPAGSVVWDSGVQHKEGVNALLLINNDNNVISGDDDGEVKVWDIRGPVKPVMQWKEHVVRILSSLVFQSIGYVYTLKFIFTL
jgi:WD40 repeat protein